MTARARWWLIRRGRCRRALDALRAGRTDLVFHELTHPGVAGDGQAEVLWTIATVMAQPSPVNANLCLDILERAGEDLDPAALEVAVAVLEPVLWQCPGHHPDHVARVARLTDRLMRVAGPLPWGHYNLAVHALQTGQFTIAADHLAAGAASPAGGWPIPLLGAACAAVLGDPTALSGWLAAPVHDPDVAQDHRLVLGTHAVFECLRDDGSVAAADRLAAAFDGPLGPLARTVPQLAALKALLAAAVRGVPISPVAGLRGCDWGRWLSDRVQYLTGDAMAVLANSAVTGDEAPAFTWQRTGSQQDLLSLVDGESARALREHFAALSARLGSAPGWTRLIDLRIQLTDTSANAAAEGDPEPESCPWWPAGGVLQPLARKESVVEHCYLAGRHALRRGQHVEARRWFASGRERLRGDGLVTWFVAMRFGPLLEYWDGVALAHLGDSAEAQAQLRPCLQGVKARDAMAQLGLLAVATGSDTDAAELLAAIPAPRPASADYLAAVLAAHQAAAERTSQALDLVERREPVAGAYLGAAQRLRGRLHESAGDLGEAAAHYRRALGHRNEDQVAAARLARVWLRLCYDDSEVPEEPLLDDRWPELPGSLSFIRDCLAGSGRELLDQAPIETGPRLLALHNAIAAGEASAAEQAARTWGGDEGADPSLVRTSLVLRATTIVREFCATGGDHRTRAELTGIEQELRSAPADPTIAFWAEAASGLLAPETLMDRAPSLAEDGGSAALRLFAGFLGTFSADAERRRVAARYCEDALEAAPVGDDHTRAAARCVIADAQGDDRAFLAAYEEIENDTALRALPWDLAASYLAAVEARLRVGDLAGVIDGFIPEQLTDLAAPGVRRAMGIAYTRRVIRTADGDARAALRDLDQARALLGETS